MTAKTFVFRKNIVQKADKLSQEFLIHKGFRYVIPYESTRSFYAKKRHFGLPLSECYGQEFSIPPEKVETFINAGLIKVNSQFASVKYLVQENDLLSFFNTNFVEKPILYFNELEVIENSKDVLVINKPSSVPVHGNARYYKNTMNYILQKEYPGLIYDNFSYHDQPLRNIHRLDAPTSGVLIYGKTSRAARVLQNMLREGKLKKYYIARVKGNFPRTIDLGGGKGRMIRVDKPMFLKEPKSHRWEFADSVAAARFLLSPNDDVGEGAQTTSLIKNALSYFQKVGYHPESDTSLVYCRPQTGRTHQLRRHLEFLGHPIIHDDKDITDNDKGNSDKGNYWDLMEEAGERLIADPIQVNPDPDFNSMRIDLHAFKYEAIGDFNCLDDDVSVGDKGNVKWQTMEFPDWTMLFPGFLQEINKIDKENEKLE